jgi:serine/threonine-protein kinase
VLGALAIVIAILIVLNAQDKKDQGPPAPTVTNTITETTPFQSPAALPGWTEHGSIGQGGQEHGATRIDPIASPAKVQVTGSRRHLASEQTWQ